MTPHRFEISRLRSWAGTRRRVALAAVLAVVLVGLPTRALVAAQDAGSPSAATAGPWVMGYHVGYQQGDLPTAEIPWASMTHLIVGAVNPNPDASLDTTFFIDPVGGPAFAKDLAAKAKANGVRPILMIGGAGSIDGWRGATATAARRTTFVNNLVSLMNSYGYEGLDLDWEPIEASDDDEVVALVNALRAAAPNAILTMPVAVANNNFTSADIRPVYGTLAAKLDRLSLMSYGMAGPYDGWDSWFFSPLHGATSSTPMAIDDTVAAYRAVGVPAAKINVGLGFYGMCYQGNVTGPRQPLNGATLVNDDNSLPYRRILQEYRNGGTYHYDTAAQAPWISYPTAYGTQRCRMLSYEDPTSIAAKGAWARTQGLGGAIVWTVAEGHLPTAPAGQRDPLMTAARAAFAPATGSVPAAPTGVTATASGTTASVAFTPGANGGSPITSFTATCTSTNGGTARSASRSASPISVTGLTTNATYTCKALATNANGNSPYSAPSATFIVRTGTPAAPTGVTVATSGTTATVSFTAGANGGSPITSFTTTCLSTNGGSLRSGSGTASPVSVSGLTTGKTYQCLTSATNATGTSPYSTPSATFLVGRVPAAPTAVTITRSGTSASVAFTPGSNGGSPITSFTATCLSTNGGAARSATGTVSPISVSALTTGKTYQCLVSATNATGAGPYSAPSASFTV